MAEKRKNLLKNLDPKNYPGFDSDRRNCGQPYEQVCDDSIHDTAFDSDRADCGKPYIDNKDIEPEL